MGLFGKKKPKITADGYLLPDKATPAKNQGPGTYDYDVVGESHYNANLRAILTEEGLDASAGGQYQTEALLLREPRNQYDPNAVAVVINTRRVGYIPKEDAAGLAPQLDALAEQGQVLVVDAQLGWSDPNIIGVRLDVEPA